MSSDTTNPENVEYDAVNPPHYRRGPILRGSIGSAITRGNGDWEHIVQCIEVMEHIQDPRLATAFKYLWRVAFGGKADPTSVGTQRSRDERDISSAIWYLQRWLSHPILPNDKGCGPVYDVVELKNGFGEVVAHIDTPAGDM